MLRVLALLLALLLAAAVPAGVTIAEGPTPAERTVTFAFAAPPDTRSVAVAGSFNEWRRDALPMREEGGVWRASIVLPADSTHEYKFVRNGSEWLADADNPAIAPGGFGGNSLLTVGEAAAPAPPARDAFAGGLSTTCTLTLEYRAPLDGEAWVLWGIDSWKAPPEALFPPGTKPVTGTSGTYPQTPLVRGDDGWYRVGLAVPSGVTVSFAVVIRAGGVDHWDNNGTLDYHVRVDADTTYRFEGRLPAPEGELPAPINRALALGMAIGGLAVAGGWAALRLDGRRALAGRAAVAVAIAALAWVAREPRVHQPSDDIDETVYIPLVQLFAQRLAAGEWRAIIDEELVQEHPRAACAMYAVAARSAGVADDYMATRLLGRRVGAAFACATALLLALRSPVAGALWALHGIAIHYTAVMYLDSPMVFFATASLLAAERAFLAEAFSRAGAGWFALSAIGAGIAVSCKYLAAPVPLAIAAIFAQRAVAMQGQQRLRWLGVFVAYAGVALAAMVASDWRLWSPDLLSRIASRVLFHRTFSTTGLVVQMDLPWHQPLRYLWGNWFGERPAWMVLWWDRVLVLGAIGGVWAAWRRAPLWLAAAVATLAFLLLWPTKWPQYVTLAVPPLAMLAASLAESAWEALRARWHAARAPDA
jgi:hypothetical protein